MALHYGNLKSENTSFLQYIGLLKVSYYEITEPNLKPVQWKSLISIQFDFPEYTGHYKELYYNYLILSRGMYVGNIDDGGQTISRSEKQRGYWQARER